MPAETSKPSFLGMSTSRIAIRGPVAANSLKRLFAIFGDSHDRQRRLALDDLLPPAAGFGGAAVPGTAARLIAAMAKPPPRTGPRRCQAPRPARTNTRPDFPPAAGSGGTAVPGTAARLIAALAKPLPAPVRAGARHRDPPERTPARFSAGRGLGRDRGAWHRRAAERGTGEASAPHGSAPVPGTETRPNRHPPDFPPAAGSGGTAVPGTAARLIAALAKPRPARVRAGARHRDPPEPTPARFSAGRGLWRDRGAWHRRATCLAPATIGASLTV